MALHTRAARPRGTTSSTKSSRSSLGGVGLVAVLCTRRDVESHPGADVLSRCCSAECHSSARGGPCVAARAAGASRATAGAPDYQEHTHTPIRIRMGCRQPRRLQYDHSCGLQRRTPHSHAHSHAAAARGPRPRPRLGPVAAWCSRFPFSCTSRLAAEGRATTGPRQYLEFVSELWRKASILWVDQRWPVLRKPFPQRFQLVQGTDRGRSDPRSAWNLRRPSVSSAASMFLRTSDRELLF